MLGILVCERSGDPPFGEASFIRRMMLAGKRRGLRVLAFDPRSWRQTDDTVRGWTRDDDGNGWLASRHRLPTLVFDRSWPDTGADRIQIRHAVQRIAAARRLRSLNAQLPNKWRVHETLSGDGGLVPLLPPTKPYGGPESLVAWMEGHGGTVFLKPACGSQGRRVASCSLSPEGAVRIRGRRGDNNPFDLTYDDRTQALWRIDRWIGKRSYLMQPLLELNGPAGEPFDIRVLAQKNGRGRWTLTGAAVRAGRPDSVTSNLHGGGSAASARETLSAWFGVEQADSLMNDIKKHARRILRRLEQAYGRFAELGLDFGIDRKGRIWFLEANSKPGRAAMAAIGTAAAERAAMQPVAYARTILLRPPGRVIHEFDHL